MKVLKFGGTSLGSAERMRHVSDLIDRTSAPCVVVLSAMAGTTDRLVDIAAYVRHGNLAAALESLSKLERQYDKVADELLASRLDEGKLFLKREFEGVTRLLSSEPFGLKEENALLARGEMISSQLMQLLFEDMNRPSRLLSSLDFMRVNEDHEPDQAYIQQEIQVALQPKSPVYITQGFICRNAYGEIDNLKRGGSDYTASLIGAALEAEEIQIWTDIDGMHNNDPRLVENTHPVGRVSFDEAAELAYFGAKVLHPMSVLPARVKNIPVRVLNTMQPEAEGTLISHDTEKGKVKSVAAKSHITAIRIRSGRMLMAYGFVRAVFEVFERYKTPVDLIATSEVAVSVTIDDQTYLEKIVDDLKSFGVVEVDRDLSIVCIVGEDIGSNKGLAFRIFHALEPIRIRMISFGGSMHNVSLLVAAEDTRQCMNLLNDSLFES